MKNPRISNATCGFHTAPVLLLTAALLLIPRLTQAQSNYDVSADFSIINNPNGVWSYGWLNQLGGTFTTFTGTTSGTAGGTLYGWYDPNDYNTGTPGISNNSSGLTFSSNGDTVPNGWASLAEGGSDELATIRFTAPTAGVYAINLVFEGADSRFPTDTDVFVYTAGSTLYTANVDGAGADSAESYSGDVSLGSGQSVDIAVGWDASRPSFNGDNTNVQGTISSVAVPEPSSTMLIVSAGLFPLLRSRHRAARR